MSVTVGDKVLLQSHPKGRNKIQNKFHDDIYEVVGVPNATGEPYVIQKNASCKPLYVTATELRKFHCTSSDYSVPTLDQSRSSPETDEAVCVGWSVSIPVVPQPVALVDNSNTTPPTRRSNRRIRPVQRLDL